MAASDRNLSPFHARNSLWFSGMWDGFVDQGLCPSRTLWCMAMRWPSATTATASLVATTSTTLLAYVNATEYQAPSKSTWELELTEAVMRVVIAYGGA